MMNPKNLSDLKKKDDDEKHIKVSDLKTKHYYSILHHNKQRIKHKAVILTYRKERIELPPTQKTLS